MIIRNLQQEFAKKTITISADFVFKNKDQYKIYFQIDRKYQSFIKFDATAFLAAAILPCMKIKEDIFIEGSVSKKIINSMAKLMNLLESWNLGLSKINIYPEKITYDLENSVNNGLFFFRRSGFFLQLLKT